MKHLAPHEFEQSALAFQPGTMTRSQRLERWAELLDRHAGRVEALERIEFLAAVDRRAAAGPNSPMAIAFADPLLRDEGLAGDTLGDAMDFFELSEREAHRLFCDCHYGGSMTGSGLARRLRTLAARRPMASIWQRARAMLA